jgi:hypothetical protein
MVNNSYLAKTRSSQTLKLIRKILISLIKIKEMRVNIYAINAKAN